MSFGRIAGHTFSHPFILRGTSPGAMLTGLDGTTVNKYLFVIKQLAQSNKKAGQNTLL
jgi:hypothetical protein